MFIKYLTGELFEFLFWPVRLIKNSTSTSRETSRKIWCLVGNCLTVSENAFITQQTWSRCLHDRLIGADGKCVQLLRSNHMTSRFSFFGKETLWCFWATLNCVCYYLLRALMSHLQNFIYIRDFLPQIMEKQWVWLPAKVGKESEEEPLKYSVIIW